MWTRFVATESCYQTKQGSPVQPANEAATARYAPAAAGREPLPGSKRWLTIKVVDVRALSGTRFQAKIRWAGTSEDGSEDTWEPLTMEALPALRYKEAWRMLEERGITRPAGRGMPRANAYADEAVRSRSKRKGYKQAVSNSQLVPATGGMPTLSGDQLTVHRGPVPAGVPTTAAIVLGHVPMCESIVAGYGSGDAMSEEGTDDSCDDVSRNVGARSTTHARKVVRRVSSGEAPAKRRRKPAPTQRKTRMLEGWQRGRWRVTAQGAEGWMLPAEVLRHAQELFLFSDNEADKEMRSAPAGEQAVIRGCANAAGVRVGYDGQGGYSDRTLGANKSHMRSDVERAVARVMRGEFRGIVVPGDGLGGVELRQRAPHTHNALLELLDWAQSTLAAWDGVPCEFADASALRQARTQESINASGSSQASAPHASGAGISDAEEEDAHMEEWEAPQEPIDVADGEDERMEDWELDNLRAEYGQLYCTAWDAISDDMLRVWLADPERLLIDGGAVYGGKRDEQGEPAPRRQWHSLQQMLRAGQLAMRSVPGDGACAIWAALAGEVDAESGDPTYPEVIAMCEAVGPTDATPEGAAKEFMRGLRRQMSRWWRREEQRDAAAACEEFCPTWEEWATRTINELSQCDMRREIWRWADAQPGEILEAADLTHVMHWLRTKARAGHVQAAQWLTKMERSTFDEMSTPSAVGDDRRVVRTWLRNIEGDKAWVSAAHLRSMAAALGRESGSMKPMIVIDSDSLSDLVWFCDSDGGPIVMRSWQETVLRCPNMLVLVWNGRDHFDGTQPL
jgi:hypothetical protein